MSGAVEPDDRPGCDHHNYYATAIATVCMLDTTSLDAMSYFCGRCLIGFIQEWVVDSERQPYEIRPL